MNYTTLHPNLSCQQKVNVIKSLRVKYPLFPQLTFTKFNSFFLDTFPVNDLPLLMQNPVL